jgi:putative transposase
VKLVATVKLLVDLDQKTRLLATMEKINEACTWLAERAFELRSADKIRLQKLYYRDLRDLFGLSSQHAVRAISKVCEVYKRDKTRCPTFRKYGAVVYDQRLYTFKRSRRLPPGTPRGSPRTG